MSSMVGVAAHPTQGLLGTRLREAHLRDLLNQAWVWLGMGGWVRLGACCSGGGQGGVQAGRDGCDHHVAQGRTTGRQQWMAPKRHDC